MSLKRVGDEIERRVPAGALAVDQRMQQAVVERQRLAERRALRAEPAEVGGMLRIALDVDAPSALRRRERRRSRRRSRGRSCASRRSCAPHAAVRVRVDATIEQDAAVLDLAADRCAPRPCRRPALRRFRGDHPVVQRAGDGACRARCPGSAARPCAGTCRRWRRLRRRRCGTRRCSRPRS